MKVNDRAPARHADLKTGVGLLRTCEISLDRYVQYIEVHPFHLLFFFIAMSLCASNLDPREFALSHKY